MQRLIDLSAFHKDASKVAATIGDLLDGFRSTGLVSDERIAFLRDCFAKPECPWIDYDDVAHEFASEYFQQNFWKSYLTFIGHEPRVALRVLDIGCGSGATSLAYLAYLNSYLESHYENDNHKTRLSIEVTFIDRSEVQLRISEMFVNRVRKILSNLDIHSSYILKDISLDHLVLASQRAKYNLILCGHILTENRHKVRNILVSSIDVAEEDGRIYAIERETDSVWKEIEISIEALALEHNIVNTAPLLSPFLVSDLTATGNSLRTNYLVARVPERGELRDLLVLYFQAWRSQDASLLQEIFTPNATYSEKPFSAPLLGLVQIQRYWSEKVLRQRAISIELGYVSYTGQQAVAEWRARFSVDGSPVDVRGMLILTLDNYTRRIISLREYFRAQHA